MVRIMIDYEKQSLKLIETAEKLLADGAVDMVLGIKNNPEAAGDTFFAKKPRMPKTLYD
jgi:hypothetical protein